MKPYYEQDGITIYHGDCRELLAHLKADVVVTDPPYGIGLGSTSGLGNGHGLALGPYASYEDTYENYCALVVPVVRDCIRFGRCGVFVGPHSHELPKPTAIGGVYCPSAAGRNEWGFKNFLPLFLYGKSPDLHLGAKIPTAIQAIEPTVQNGHPCPKPIRWMKWAVLLTSRVGETILDPFMGSGTTLVAAKLEGRKAIGIEIEERYCEIAAKRLAQGVLNFDGVSP